MKKKPCRCARWKFPHRFELACEDYIKPEREGKSESDRLYWADYHQRVSDLKRELGA